MYFIYKMAIGLAAAFAITMILLKFLPGEKVLLGHDRGPANIGKPTGVGFYFMLVFLGISALLCFIYNPVTSDKGLFESGNEVTGLAMGLIATLAAMVTGWLDDRSKDAWNEYLKGALDFIVSLIGAFICRLKSGRFLSPRCDPLRRIDQCNKRHGRHRRPVRYPLYPRGIHDIPHGIHGTFPARQEFDHTAGRLHSFGHGLSSL